MNTLHNDAQTIFETGLKRVDPIEMMIQVLSLKGNHLTLKTENTNRTFDLTQYKNIYVLGAGKASARMALALEQILGDKITKGLVVVKTGHTESLKKIALKEASHPIPDQSSHDGAKALLELAKQANKDDLVVTLISGGGSALATLPVDGVTLADKQAITKQLLGSEATIHEINAVRKHLSQIKGGNLAKAIAPATALNLILSDVMGDDLDTIASGMTAPDSKTFADVEEILTRYNISPPDSITQIIEKGLQGKIQDTPKADDQVFSNCQNIIIGSNYQALLASMEKAKELGYNTLGLTSRLMGEASEIAKVFLIISLDIQDKDFPIKKPACIIAGGETTVHLKGRGKGGRNQEMALSFLCELSRLAPPTDKIMFLSASTDGSDGPTDATGAFAYYDELNKAQKLSLSPHLFLADNNSYEFFDKLGELLRTGPTNTNVCDLQILLLR